MHHADAGRHGPLRVGEGDRASVDQDLAAVGLVQPVQHVHQRRLAGPVLTQQAVNLARANVQVDGVVGDERTELLGDRPQLQAPSESAVLQVVGMNWFLVMITAAYVGMACQLVSELVAGKYANDRPANHTPGRLAASVRGCGVLIESLAAELDSASVEPAHMQQRLLDARAAVESVLKVLGAETPDCMNGAQFIGTSRLSYLREAISGLTFHPPSRDERFVSGGMEI